MIARVGHVKGSVGSYRAARIYIQHPVLCNVNFVFPHCASERYYLTVYVCKADLVIVYKVKRADTGTCQRLDGVAADAAYTEHCHTGVFELIKAFAADNKLCS